MTFTLTPVDVHDPVNVAILAVSEDRLQGFHEDPFGEIARLSGVPAADVLARVRAMLEAGTVRRVRQTVMSTNLAAGALVAWRLPPSRLQEAFEFMFEQDPFSGHVVIRSTDGATAGSAYRLWTTLKVPQGYSLAKHAVWLAERVGAEAYRLMPAKRMFALGVGHVRRRGMEPGSKADAPADVVDTTVVRLTDLEWRVLEHLKRELAPAELRRDLWRLRAAEAGLGYEDFVAVAHGLAGRGVIGRFSTFLEHVKPLADGRPVTRYNALFHWAIPPGREIEAGREVGRHHIMTHAYWREAGPEFGNVNIMGVTHGMEKEAVLAHKAAIDTHLSALGIPVAYTNVFWGGRSEIKPSEVLPAAYRVWCVRVGIEPTAMWAEGDEPAAAG